MGTIEDLNAGCEVLAYVEIGGMWFTDTRYGVTLTAKMLVVKPGTQVPVSINDMGLADNWQW